MLYVEFVPKIPFRSFVVFVSSMFQFFGDDLHLSIIFVVGAQYYVEISSEESKVWFVLCGGNELQGSIMKHIV